MIEALSFPDPFVLARTLLAAVIFLYLPGHLWLHGDWKKWIEAIVFSVLLLSCVGIALAFSVGINEMTIVVSYALLGGFWWWTKRKL